MDNFVPPTHEIFCAGKPMPGAEVLEVRNPYDNSLAGLTWLADKDQLDQALTKALEVAPALAAMPSYIRYDALMHIAEQIGNLKHQFAECICRESGKPIRYATAEVDRSIQTFKVAAEECRRIPVEHMRLDWTPSGEGKAGALHYFPAGIVAAISPFNFPLNLAVHKIAPAIAAGCPVVLKPSSRAPLSILMLAPLILQTGLPPGAVSILPMDRTVGNLLVTDPRPAILSFTGSAEVGWKMKQDAWRKKVILELGGNAGLIVSSYTDIASTVSKCVQGSFSFSGQVCIHTQRIFVKQALFDGFTQAFVSEVKNLRYGDPLCPDTDISGMIDEANAIRVEQWVGQAIQAGARVLAGGNRRGAYYPPTVLTGTTDDMKVCSHEIFGPVVSIEPFDDLSKAITRINAGNFGLQAGIFTLDINEINQAFRGILAGGVIVNDVPTFRVDHMPYGGIRDSGVGREGVKYTILEYLEPKLLVSGSMN